MPRLVVSRSAALGRFAAASLNAASADDYKDRLVKYIPAESVAFYTFVDRLLSSHYGLAAPPSSTAHHADQLLFICSWAFLLLGIVGTPIYLYRQRLPDQPWRLHAGISTVAFVLWAYTLGGSVFVLHHWYDTLGAGIAAPLFTFVAGWFEPRTP